MHSKLVRAPGLYLVGFMGCGKTTVGTLLADELGWTFIDLDDDIEAAAGTTISEVFETRGEEVFREFERAALAKRVRNVQYGQPAVISLGGGAFAQAGNVELVESGGVSIWLDCSLERIRRRIADEHHRPLAQDPVRFEQLYHDRKESYSRADFRVDSSVDDPKQIVQTILALPLF